MYPITAEWALERSLHFFHLDFFLLVCAWNPMDIWICIKISTQNLIFNMKRYFPVNDFLGHFRFVCVCVFAVIVGYEIWIFFPLLERILI